jgi:hypothetical protein
LIARGRLGDIRFALPFLAVVFALALPSVAQEQSPPHQRTVSELVKATLDSVVLIVVSDSLGKPLAAGSGFIVSPDGRVVTNHHVIADAWSATVKLNNGATFAVDGVLADDSVHDLAVVKVSGKNLPALPLGDSDRLSVGDHVVAIGSPLGFLENSVSDGIVSAIREGGNGTLWIQTTAAASHGNSGGPLLTMDGQVVGVLTLKATEGENLNFAVPSKLISPLLTNATVRAFGVASSSDSSVLTGGGNSALWTSMMSGHDFKLRTEGDYIYAEWANIPASLQSTAAFVRSELKRDGDRWTGKTRSYLPCDYKSSYSEYWTTGQRKGTTNVKWCSVESDIRIDKLSADRIEGIGQVPSQFDCRKCQVRKWESKPFTWIPK